MDGQYVTVRTSLTQKEQSKLLAFLRKNKDVFKWSSKDLVGVSKDVIENKLTVRDEVKPKKQQLRKMSDEKVMAVKAEV